ncbi:hypothetical protein U9M48_003660 [Paspalum notatum var. saurae]|uniref:Uncharacterized protein n=1 Tax=Paspalum notatum var. saurae TaxID=547442 RepID=A0AAQ3PJA9_PASNO
MIVVHLIAFRRRRGRHPVYLQNLRASSAEEAEVRRGAVVAGKQGKQSVERRRGDGVLSSSWRDGSGGVLVGAACGSLLGIDGGSHLVLLGLASASFFPASSFPVPLSLCPSGGGLEWNGACPKGGLGF